jgi:hypothetical protein
MAPDKVFYSPELFGTINCGYPVSDILAEEFLKEYTTEETVKYVPDDMRYLCDTMRYGLPLTTVSNAWDHFRTIKGRILLL